MSRPRLQSRRKNKEEGQTLVLVAISLLVLIAMATLAIDLTTLYVARGEMQRAADAAALAGAKAFVDSGVTTAPAAPNPDGSNLQLLATTMATAYVNAAVAQNNVGGISPTLVGAVTPDYTSHPGNPQLTVTLQRTNVPTFFAHIFGQRLVTVSATAIAEAYNSSNPSGTAGATTMPPVGPQGVKPWLVVNRDPDHTGGTGAFIDSNGSLVNPGVWITPAPPPNSWTCAAGGSGGVIGECLTLMNRFGDTSPLSNPGYLPAAVPNSPSGGTCPSCAAGDDFAESIACFDTANAVQYSAQNSCNTTATILNVDTNNDNADTLSGAACLATIPGGGGVPGPGQDTIELNNFPTGPYEITAGGGPHNGSVVNTSNQIVTLPIISTTLNGTEATIIGYMQAFLVGTVQVGGGGGNVGITIYVLNISGCGANVNTAAPPVTGGGVSPVPVRLIHN